MNRLQQIALGATLAVVAWAIAGNRPARLASIRVTAITPGSQLVAHVALTYHPGRRPECLIIDITTPTGSGSITLDGETLYAQVPLIASQPGPQQIATTMFHQTIGSTTRMIQQFA